MPVSASTSSPSLGPTGKPPLSPPKPPTAIPVATPAPITTTTSTTSTPTPPTITPATLLSHAHLHHPIPTKIVGYGSLPHPTTPRTFHHDRSMSASGSMLTRPIFTVHKRQHSNHMSLLNLTADAMILKHAQQLQSLSLQGTLSAQIIQPIPNITTTTTTTTTTTEGPNLAKLAFQRKWDDVRDMILKGWNCNERYGAMGGWTAAHEACLHNRHDILQLLYDHGGDMTTQNQSGNTPLHVTCMSDSAECTKLLLDWGVPIHVKNKWNATPFDFAKNRTIRCMLEAKLTPEERSVLESIRDENIRIAAQTTKRKKPSDELIVSDENETITSIHDTNMQETTSNESHQPEQSPFKKPTHTRNASSLSMDTLTLDTTKRVRHSISEDTPTTAFSTTFLNSTNKSTSSSTSNNPTLCIVCNNNQKAMMYHPCCHVACCTNCDTFQTRCPMCNTSIAGRKTISL